jgi:perosamine synthetase
VNGHSGKSVGRICVAQPDLAGNERAYVLDCLDTNWISSNGKYLPAFEERFASYCGVRHAVATCNGTAALHLALAAHGVQAGDEVLVPAVTYIATANAVRYCGATPVLVDVLPGTLNIDPAAAEKRITARTRGIIPVHLYGHPAAMDDIAGLAARHGLFVVEDAAEAHGAEFAGRRAGSLGDCATFSFYGNKIISTGEGGMVTTDSSELAGRLRLLRGQGMDPERRYWFPIIGFNYRMTNIQAAIGLGQLENIDRALALRRDLAGRYRSLLAGLEDRILLPGEAPGVKHAFWMFNIFLRHGGETERDAVMAALDAAGIETRPVFYPLHWLPPYREETPYPVADIWASRGINLPTHTGLSEADLERICSALAGALES